MSKKYNTKHIGVRRIRQEMKELHADKSVMYRAMATEENIFNWHFVIRGPPDSDFEGGVYCGRIQLPSEYPYKPPNIILDTPNGRFRQGEKICLSISAYHPEKWHPAWGVRTILEALISFFPTPGEGAVAALDWPKKDRQLLAKRSHAYNTANKLYRTLEPLQPATKEEIIKAQQSFCDEAKDTAAMSSYQPKKGSPAPTKAASAPTSSQAAAAAAPTATVEGGAPSSATAAVRRRPAAASTASSAQRPGAAGAGPARNAQPKPAATKSSSSCGTLTFVMCLLMLLLVFLVVRKFNKTTIV